MGRHVRVTGIRPPRLAPLAAFIVILCFPATAAGHADLARSAPAANSSVTSTPAELVLTFTESIDPANSSVTLLDENQRELPRSGSLRVDAAGTTARTPLPAALPPGIYVVNYRVTSEKDGHVTSGQFAFRLDPTGTLPSPAGSATTGSPSVDPGIIAARWAALVLLLLVFGTTLFWLASARPAIAAVRGPDAGPDADRGAGPAAVSGGSWIWAVLALLASGAFAALAIFLSLSAAAIGSAATAGDHARFPLDFAAPFGWTSFAIAMRVALVGTAVTLVLGAARALTVAARRRRGRAVGGRVRDLRDRAALLGTLVAAAVALAGMSFAGHAAAGGGPLFAAVDWVHLLAVAAWLGTLGGLALLAWGSRGLGTDGRSLLGGALARHSRLAMVAAPLVVLTGLANSPIVIGQAREVVASDYGNLVIAKATLFSAAVALGAVNFFLVRRHATGRTATLVAGEAILGLVAVAVAATMLTIQPAASRAPTLSASASQTAHLYGAAGASDVHAAIDIPAPGPQLYQVAVSDAATGAPRTDVQAIVLEFTPPPASQLATEHVGLTRTPDTTIWSVQGTYTPVVGEWRVNVLVHRGGLLESASLPLTVEMPLPPQLVPPPDTGVGVPAVLAALWLLPDGLAGWLVLCLPLAAAAVIALLERSRRSLRPARWMALARVALVVVALVAGLGVGSRAVVEAANRGTVRATNPIPATADSISRGMLIYLANCSTCHGGNGLGNGPQAAGMLPAPGPVGSPIAAMSDSELQYLVTNGVAGTKMPSFATTLSENDRWDLVNYLHSQWPGAR